MQRRITQGRPENYERHGQAFVYGAFFIEGSPEEAAHLAALRERVGDDMVDRLQCSRELMRHPRPLTDSEREVMRNAIAPLLRDLEVSGAIVPEVRYEAHDDGGRDGREGVHAWITAGGTGGMGVWTPTEENPNAPSIHIPIRCSRTWRAKIVQCGAVPGRGE